ncbi:TSUP family transporter [uncultured Cellulomonas sp.]|uniref:TSUP family transporter n=1 Tax=uncultured Cellulomonas sp. TaxID=189682 RepID=UPI0026042941|nr:TSUP family transporter [uncultured Cellulomonas sp.]
MLVVGVAAAAQVLSGLGFALVAGPLLALTLGTTDAVRLSVTMSLVLNVVLLTCTYRLVRWGDALRLFVPAALLVVPTFLLTTRLSSAWVSATAGAAVLLGVVLIASGWRARWVDAPVGAVAAGAASGVLNVLGGVSGPPVALFVAHRGWAPAVSAATLQAYAMPLNVVTLGALGLPVGEPRWVWAGLGLVLGAGAAWPFRRRISAGTVRTLVLVLATSGALMLLVEAWEISG